MSASAMYLMATDLCRVTIEHRACPGWCPVCDKCATPDDEDSCQTLLIEHYERQAS
jgi:hypothetical protein